MGQREIGKQIVTRTMGAGATQGALGQAASDAAGRQATQAMASQAFGGQQNVPSFVNDAMKPPPPKNPQGFLTQAMGQAMGSQQQPSMQNPMSQAMSKFGGYPQQPSMQNPMSQAMGRFSGSSP